MAKRKSAEAAPEPVKAEGRGTISVDTAAKLLMVSPRRVQQLVAEGWIEKNGRGEYTIVGVVQGYIRFRDDVERKAQQNTAEARLKNRREQMIELQMLERSGELQRKAEALAMERCDVIIGGMVSDLMALPARLTADLPLRRKIEAAIDDVLRANAERARPSSEDRGPGSGADDAGEEDDA